MIEEGLILYFTQFHFKNGNPPKSKYFIILRRTGNNLILASLPSSKDYVPSSWEKNNQCACIEIAQASFNCFFFAAGIPITTKGWGFPLDTYLYGNQIDEYELELLNERYPTEGIDYDIIGQITGELFSEILHCLKASASVKRRFKIIL